MSFQKFLLKTLYLAGHYDFLHPLQALFMYALVTDWKLNQGFIIFETIGTLITKLCNPNLKLTKLSLLYWMLLTMIFNHFYVPSTISIALPPNLLTPLLLHSCVFLSSRLHPVLGILFQNPLSLLRLLCFPVVV